MTFAAIQSACVRIPSRWSVMPFKRVAALQEEPDATAEATLLSLKNTGELVPRADDVQPPSADHRLRYWHVDRGNLVVNPMWLAGGAIGVSLVSGAVSPDYRVYSLSARVEPRFVHHLFRSVPYRDQYRLLMRAETTFDRRVTKEDFAELPVLLPPLDEQRAIVDLLDAETAQIDALIEKKRQLIDLLKERQQALVDEAVRDHRTQPLKHAAEIVVSNVDKLTTEGQQPVRLCNYTDVYYRRRITDALEFMTASATDEQIARFGLKAGDVLITKDSETADDIAVPAYVPADLPGVVCGYHLAVLKPRVGEAEGTYLYWALRSQFVRQQFTVSATGVTRFGLRTDAIGAARIPLPERMIQLETADRLEGEQARVDRLTDALDRQIALLRERRQAVITAAVTGHLNVTEAAA